MKHESKSTKQPAAKSKHRTGTKASIANPLLRHMIKSGKPMTRDHYLAFNYPGGVPEEFGPELEQELPPGMRLDEHGRDPTRVAQKPGKNQEKPRKPR